MRDGAEIVGIEAERRVLDLGLEGLGQRAANLALDDPPRLAIGHAEEALQHPIRRNRKAVPRQRFRMRATGNHLAVDQHAVAIENDEIETHPAYDLLSSSSGTQYSSRR
ncbi:hypothetical protein AB7M50_005897 [Bradyrhizobium elkanii]